MPHITKYEGKKDIIKIANTVLKIPYMNSKV